MCVYVHVCVCVRPQVIKNKVMDIEPKVSNVTAIELKFM